MCDVLVALENDPLAERCAVNASGLQESRGKESSAGLGQFSVRFCGALSVNARRSHALDELKKPPIQRRLLLWTPCTTAPIDVGRGELVDGCSSLK